MTRRSRKKNAPAAAAPLSASHGKRLESWIKAHTRQIIFASLALNLVPAVQEHSADFKVEFVQQNPLTAVLKVLP